MTSVILRVMNRCEDCIKDKESYKRKTDRKKQVEKKEKINWIQEIRIAFFTSILFMIFTAFLFWMAHRISPGEFEGEKLERYLKKELSDMLDISFRNSDIWFEKQYEMDSSGTGDHAVKLICGSYGEKEEISPSGRFISVWTRREQGFWNELFGTEPRYEIDFLKISNEKYHSSTLMCEDIGCEDFDENNLMDFKVSYKSIFGDRSSKTIIYLLQDVEGWQFVVPDLSVVEQEIEQDTEVHRTAMLDVFKFYDVGRTLESENVYSLSMYGNFVSEHWGMQTEGGMVFYGEDVR